MLIDEKTAAEKVALAHQQNLESVLRSLLIVSAGLTLTSVLLIGLVPGIFPQVQPRTYLFLLGVNGVQWFFALYQRIPYRVRAAFFLLSLLSTNFIPLPSSGLSSTSRISFVYFVVMCFMLLGRLAGVIALLFSCIVLIVVGLLGANQIITFNGEIDLAGQLTNFALTFLIIFYATYRLRSLTNQQAEAQSRFSKQLEDERANLELAVARRTHALSTASAISQKLLTIYEENELLTMVVSSLSEAFNYYHVHIYMLDADESLLQMRAGSGDVGMALYTIGHAVPFGKGLVGQSALMNISIFVPDVQQDKNWLPNPLLPDTQSEIVVPITFGEKVLGVLDVQDNRAGGLMQEDVNVLETVALQLGVALRNAEIYRRARQSASQKVALNEIARQIRGARSVEKTLETAVEGLGLHLDGSTTAARLDMGRLAKNRSVTPKVQGEVA